LLLLLVGLLCPLAAAQERKVTLELENGKVVTGRVAEIDSRSITVEADGERHSYSTSQIRKCQFEDVASDPAPGPAPAPAGETAPAKAAPKQDPAPDGGGAASSPAAAPAPHRHVRALWDARIDALDRAYPWLFPAERLQWISLGV